MQIDSCILGRVLLRLPLDINWISNKEGTIIKVEFLIFGIEGAICDLKLLTISWISVASLAFLGIILKSNWNVLLSIVSKTLSIWLLVTLPALSSYAPARDDNSAPADCLALFATTFFAKSAIFLLINR